MTAATLRQAADSMTTRAAEMRAAFPDSSEPGFLEAVAAWLISTANDVEHVHTPVYNLTSTTVARALATARAWLGEDS